MEEEEEICVCPYEPNHRIKFERFRAHLLRCKEGIKMKHLFRQCKYNSLHIYRKSEIDSHQFVCPDREKCEKTFKMFKAVIQGKDIPKQESKQEENEVKTEFQRNQHFLSMSSESSNEDSHSRSRSRDRKSINSSRSDCEELDDNMLTLSKCKECKQKLKLYFKQPKQENDVIVTLIQKYKALNN